MSLEQALKENTIALVALTAALSVNAAAPKAPAAKPDIPPAAATPPATTPPAAGTEPLTYKAVAEVVSAFVVKNGRAAAKALLAPFGVETLVPLQDKPVELAGAYAAFTDPVKTAAAIAAHPKK